MLAYAAKGGTLLKALLGQEEKVAAEVFSIFFSIPEPAKYLTILDWLQSCPSAEPCDCEKLDF